MLVIHNSSDPSLLHMIIQCPLCDAKNEFKVRKRSLHLLDERLQCYKCTHPGKWSIGTWKDFDEDPWEIMSYPQFEEFDT